MNKRVDKLFNRNFLLLCQGMFISIFGSQAYYIAESLLVMHHTQSGAMVGLVLAVSALPHLLFGAIGGVFADRYDRRLMIIACDVLAGMACLLLALYLWKGEGAFIVPAVMIAGFLLNTLLCFFGPSGRALIPMLVPGRSLIKANSFYKTLKNIAKKRKTKM